MRKLNIEAQIASDYVEAVVLAAGAAQRIPIPAGAAYANLMGTKDYYALYGGGDVTAAVPSNTTTDGTAPALNLGNRQIPGGATHISVVAPEACAVTIEFFGA
jgi:hypothetical protein